MAKAGEAATAAKTSAHARAVRTARKPKAVLRLSMRKGSVE